MRRHVRLALAAIVALCVAGCGGTTGSGRVGSAAGGQDPAARYAALRDLDARIGAVWRRLVEANVDLCPAVGPDAGWTLHAANQYGPELRPHLPPDMIGDLPAVLAVAPGSPALSAGLEPGDVFLAIDGASFEVGAIGRSEDYEGVSRNLAKLEAALVADEPSALTVRRGAVTRDLALTPSKACAYQVHLDVSDELNARADGRGVFISSSLARFAGTDDELAVILAHELAHNVLRHRERFDREAPARRVFGNLAINPSSLLEAEREADRWGLYLMERAGFSGDVAPDFWRRFGAANWRVRWAQWGYPSAEGRAKQLEIVVAEIAALRDAGEPIDPR